MTGPETLRRLSPLGRAALVVGIAALGLGWWLRWQEFIQVGVMSVVLVVAALLWVSLPGSPRVALSVHPRRLTEGGRAAEAALVIGAGTLPVLAPQVEISVGGRVSTVVLPVVPPHSESRRAVELPPLRRGVHVVGPVNYQRTDFLRLARRSVQVAGSEQVLVRPRTTDLELISGGLTNLDGMVSRQLSMSDLAFHALREYVRGDDLRHVHWRSSAKTDRLQVRQYHETKKGQVTVLIDHESTSYPTSDDFELAVSVAASVALRAARDDCDTYMRCHDQVVHGRSPETLLDGACRFGTGASAFAAAVRATAAAVPTSGLVVLVSGTSREPAQLRAAAAQLNREAARILVRCGQDGQARVAEKDGSREIVVTRLGELRGLLLVKR